jgi:hypothetical protein
VLVVKSLWRAKYLKGKDVIFWFYSGLYKFYVLSNFWRNLLDSLPLLENCLAWSVGNGARVLLGQDHFLVVDLHIGYHML